MKTFFSSCEIECEHDDRIGNLSSIDTIGMDAVHRNADCFS